MPGDKGDFTAREVKAEFTVGGVSIPINGFSLSHSVNELPSATLSLQVQLLDQVNDPKDQTGSVEINLDMWRDICAMLQQKVLNKPTVEPDAVFSVLDPNGQRVNLHGFLGRPSFELQQGQLKVNASLVHRMAVLQGWSGQIYPRIQHYAMDFFDQLEDTDSVALLLKSVLDHAMENVVFSPMLDTGQFDGWPVHVLNKEVLRFVHKVLDDSVEKTRIPDLGKSDQLLSNLSSQLRELLIDSPNFLQMLYRMLNMFLFQINTDYEGRLWLEISETQADPGDRIIQTPTENIRFSMSTVYEFPLLQVMVQAPIYEFYTLSGTTKQPQGSDATEVSGMTGAQFINANMLSTGEAATRFEAAAKYPEAVDKDAVGTFYVVQVPRWLALATFPSYIVEQAAKDSENRSENVVENLQQVADERLKTLEPHAQVLKYWAKHIFEHMYLQHTEATVVIPFDLRPLPGRTYTVADNKGIPLFVGFLVRVQHEVLMAEGGSGGRASTILSFSHIKVSGAKLNAFQEHAPGLETSGSFKSTDSTYTLPGSLA